MRSKCAGIDLGCAFLCVAPPRSVGLGAFRTRTTVHGRETHITNQNSSVLDSNGVLQTMCDASSAMVANDMQALDNCISPLLLSALMRRDQRDSPCRLGATSSGPHFGVRGVPLSPTGRQRLPPVHARTHANLNCASRRIESRFQPRGASGRVFSVGRIYPGNWCLS